MPPSPGLGIKDNVGVDDLVTGQAASTPQRILGLLLYK